MITCFIKYRKISAGLFLVGYALILFTALVHYDNLNVSLFEKPTFIENNLSSSAFHHENICLLNHYNFNQDFSKSANSFHALVSFESLPFLLQDNLSQVNLIFPFSRRGPPVC